MNRYIIAAVFAALPFTSQANGIQCPDGSWRDSPTHCPTAPQPQPQAPGAVGVGVGIGTGGHGGSGGHATGGTSFGGNQSQAQQQGQSVNVQQGGINIRNRSAASAAIAAPLPGTGMPNCFGDINPSGSFSAAFGNIFAGASASSQKASNICAAYAIGGEELALRYLQRMDPSMPRSVVVNRPTGRITCPASHPVYVEGRGCRQ